MNLGQIVTALGSLALVLAAVLAARPLAARLLARGGIAGPRAARLSLVQMLPLDTRRRVLLLRCDDREFLVLSGTTETFLGWIERG
ncbi:MAG: flagellar biosynthetic protein FliO [Rhodospirillales bacterium]|nr:flagellar biosynthetic protein FliO [Rhodospirillales bacterium]